MQGELIRFETILSRLAPSQSGEVEIAHSSKRPSDQRAQLGRPSPSWLQKALAEKVKAWASPLHPYAHAPLSLPPFQCRVRPFRWSSCPLFLTLSSNSIFSIRIFSQLEGFSCVLHRLFELAPTSLSVFGYEERCFSTIHPLFAFSVFDAHPLLTLAQREAGFRKKGVGQRLEGGISSIYDFARAGCTTIFSGAEHRKGSLPRISQPYVSAVLPYQRISKQASSLPLPTSITAVGGGTLAFLCPDSPIVSISTHAAPPSTPSVACGESVRDGATLGAMHHRKSCPYRFSTPLGRARLPRRSTSLLGCSERAPKQRSGYIAGRKKTAN